MNNKNSDMLDKEVSKLKRENKRLKEELNIYQNSKAGRITKKYYDLLHKSRLFKILMKTILLLLWPLRKTVSLLRSVKTRGVKNSLRFLTYKLGYVRGIHKIKEYFVQKKLDKILREIEGKEVILSLSFIDWNVPLYQRPQHVAIQLAKQGYLYFYHTRNYYDYIDGYKKIGENMYLTNRFDELSDKLKDKKKYIHLYSTNMYEDDDKRIKDAIKNGDKILYEYIDEISDEISGTKIPKFVYNRHERLLEDQENCFVIATASKLYNDVAEHREKNFKLVTNGVVLEHFRDIKEVVPKEIEGIVKNEKPIIGYYGALASWFDYKMVKEMAKLKNDWNILLIGWDYDGSLSRSGLGNMDNVSIIGPVEYINLPKYAQWFDVCTIPFKINEITKSTSPVKLFEYMALGKPIVTTPMPECKKYESVILTENNGKDFVKNIELALGKKEDKEYLKVLKREAKENTWESKARDIAKLIGG